MFVALATHVDTMPVHWLAFGKKGREIVDKHFFGNLYKSKEFG